MFRSRGSLLAKARQILTVVRVQRLLRPEMWQFARRVGRVCDRGFRHRVGIGTASSAMNARLHLSLRQKWSRPLKPDDGVAHERADAALASSRAAQRDDGQISAPVDARDDEIQRAHTTDPTTCSKLFATDRISSARLDAAPQARGQALVAHLRRSRASERSMRAVGVVPGHEHFELTANVALSKRHQDFAQPLLLQRSHEPFENRDGAMLADGAEPRLDAVAVAPPDVVSSELDTLIRDDVLGCEDAARDGAIEHVTHFSGRGLLAEYLDADDNTREVIEHHADPPREWPPLRERLRQHGTHKPAMVGMTGSRHSTRDADSAR